MITIETLLSVREFAKELEQLSIKETEIPKLVIPNWPKGFSAQINLGKRNYLYAMTTHKTGMLKLIRYRHKLFCQIGNDEQNKRNGIFSFSLKGLFKPMHPSGYSMNYYANNGSNSDSNVERIRALLLFYQFKADIFSGALKQLKVDLPCHNRVADEIARAFEPFIPFIVADTLTT